MTRALKIFGWLIVLTLAAEIARDGFSQ